MDPIRTRILKGFIFSSFSKDACLSLVKKTRWILPLMHLNSSHVVSDAHFVKLQMSSIDPAVVIENLRRE